MRIGCVVLNYNDAKTTIDLLKKIDNYEVFFKICVVDNNSSDDSFSQLKLFENNKIDVIKSDKNGGYGYGNNYGVRHLKNKYTCDYVLIANPDTIFEESVVQHLLDYFDKDTAIVAPLALTIDGTPQKPIAWKCPNKSTFYLFSSLLLNKIINPMPYKDDKYIDKYCEVDCVQGAMFILDVSKFNEFGMYDDKIFLYFEESSLGIRLKKHNYKTKLIPSIKYIHNHSQTIDKVFCSEYSKRKLMIRSLYTVMNNEFGYDLIERIFNNIYMRLCFIENYIIFKIYYLFGK